MLMNLGVAHQEHMQDSDENKEMQDGLPGSQGCQVCRMEEGFQSVKTKWPHRDPGTTGKSQNEGQEYQEKTNRGTPGCLKFP